MERQSGAMLPWVAKLNFDKLEQTTLKSLKSRLLWNSDLPRILHNILYCHTTHTLHAHGDKDYWDTLKRFRKLNYPLRGETVECSATKTIKKNVNSACTAKSSLPFHISIAWTFKRQLLKRFSINSYGHSCNEVHEKGFFLDLWILAVLNSCLCPSCGHSASVTAAAWLGNPVPVHVQGAVCYMPPTATATSGKHEQWRVAVHMPIKDPQTAAQRMGCQMEEIKFEYINEEEQARRHGGRGKSCFEKEVGHRTGRISENP